jgi:hypothetical protein
MGVFLQNERLCLVASAPKTLVGQKFHRAVSPNTRTAKIKVVAPLSRPTRHATTLAQPLSRCQILLAPNEISA